MTSYSQVFQDVFVHTLIGDTGYFLDLGAGDPEGGLNSNTLLLEQKGWDGICVDGHAHHIKNRVDASIRSSAVCAFVPQTTIKEILDNHNAPKVLDYVSVDIEPVSITALHNFPFEEYEFKVMTFEHDLYLRGPAQKIESHDILTRKGYVLLCNNVNVPDVLGFGKYFEDWWVNPKYFSEEFIQTNQFDSELGRNIVTNIRK